MTSSRTLTARITHLEMTARPLYRVPAPLGAQLAVMRAPRMPLHFYRYLYERVGRPHHWELRRGMDDDALSAIIHATTTLIDVLYVDGAPAGFVEIDLSRAPEQAEVEYFGLMAEFQGRGLSKFFLSCALHAAWQHDPKTLIIQTNSLDSPRALQLYQTMGFVPVGTSQAEVEAWD
jgi:GNAT superfamily N-acetyltransferase